MTDLDPLIVEQTAPDPHPTHKQILAQEPSASRSDGSNADKVALRGAVGCYLSQLELRVPALDKRHNVTKVPFIPPPASKVLTEFGIPERRASVKQPPRRQASVEQTVVEKKSNPWELHCAPLPMYADLNFTAISDIWRVADADGDNMMSCSEAKEIVRVFLASPEIRQTLGVVLRKNCAQIMLANDQLSRIREQLDPQDWRFHDKMTLEQLCEHCVSHACLRVARKIPQVTVKFWEHMDLDVDTEVDSKEFKYHFQNAAIAHIIPPIWHLSETRIRDIIGSGAWKADSYEDLDPMINEYHQSQNATNWARMLKMPKSSGKSDNCGVCSTDECVVM